MCAIQIVLVEDNRSDASLIEEIIADTRLEHSLTWLRDGEEAIGYFDKGGWADFIILDLNLPKVNGHEVLRFLRGHKACRDIPVIVMTGSTSPLDRSLAKDRGVRCYLVKPMTIEEIDLITRSLNDIFMNPRLCSG
jgi:CheY-like chemotaxis protein